MRTFYEKDVFMPFSEFIENLDLDCANYRSGTIPIIQCGNRIGNDIFYKSFRGRADVKISFSSGVGSRVYIGSEFEGSLNLQISASNCLVYIGNFSRLNDVTIKIRSDMGRVFVGNGVTTSGKNLWLNGSSVGFPKDIVIGDDCMFSWGVTIRNTDGHPIYDVKSWEVLNSASSPLIIEPHCWIGQNATILKNVTVGACSIVALGAVVTKSVARFSSASGAPSVVRSIEGKLWSRGSKRSMLEALKYLERYAVKGSFSLPNINTSAAESDELFDD